MIKTQSCLLVVHELTASSSHARRDGCSPSQQSQLTHRTHASACHMIDVCILTHIQMGGGRFSTALIEEKIWERVCQNNLSILHLFLYVRIRYRWEESDKIKVLGFIILNRSVDCELVMPTAAFTYTAARFQLNNFYRTCDNLLREHREIILNLDDVSPISEGMVNYILRL